MAWDVTPSTDFFTAMRRSCGSMTNVSRKTELFAHKHCRMAYGAWQGLGNVVARGGHTTDSILGSRFDGLE